MNEDNVDSEFIRHRTVELAIVQHLAVLALMPTSTLTSSCEQSLRFAWR